MDFELRAWYVFGGVVLFCMGLGLALDAEARARLAAQWPSGGARAPTGEPGRSFVWAYRAGGLALCAAGLYGLASVWWFPANMTRARGFSLSPAGHAAAGSLLVLTGLGMGWMKLAELIGPGRRFAFLEREGLLPAARRGPAQRVAAFSGWIVAFSCIAFGFLLLSRTSIGGAHYGHNP